MQRIDIGIVSNCRSFRVALDTMLKEESNGEVHCLWDEVVPSAVSTEQGAVLTKPQLIIVDLDHTLVPISKVLKRVRDKFRRVKLVLLVGRKELPIKSILNYHVDKVLKRNCSEIELMAAIRACMPAEA